MEPACTEGSDGVQVHNPVDRGCPQCPGVLIASSPCYFSLFPTVPLEGLTLCLLEKETEAVLGHPAELDEPVQSRLLIE